MMRTFCTPVRDASLSATLDAVARVLAPARHWCFREIHVRGRPTKDVKREALALFGITARHFNGLRFELDQAVQAWRGSVRYRISQVRDRIDAVEARIERLDKQVQTAKSDANQAKLRLSRRGKRRHLDRLQASHVRLQAELLGKPRVCFGGRKLLRDGDVAGWKAARASSFTLVGSKDETAGNQSAQWDGATLRVRLPDAIGGGHLAIPAIRFRYGQEVLEATLGRGGAITWRLFRDDAGAWQVRATVDEPAAEVVTDRRLGAVGIDLNVDHLAVVEVDRMGNPCGRRTLPFPDRVAARGGGNRATATIGETVRELVDMARASGRPLAVERLDFTREKAALKEYGPSHARRLSSFAYARFAQMLKARCARDGVEVIEVDHAFTSVIGRLKYAKGHALSPHGAAALVIGRRAQGMGERFVRMGHGALDGPGRNGSRHAWLRWRGAKPRPDRTARAARPGRVRDHGGHGRARATATDPPRRSVERRGAGTGSGPHQVGGAVAPATGSGRNA